jgi:hypothetical protein
MLSTKDNPFNTRQPQVSSFSDLIPYLGDCKIILGRLLMAVYRCGLYYPFFLQATFMILHR